MAMQIKHESPPRPPPLPSSLYLKVFYGYSPLLFLPFFKERPPRKSVFASFAGKQQPYPIINYNFIYR